MAQGKNGLVSNISTQHAIALAQDAFYDNVHGSPCNGQFANDFHTKIFQSSQGK